MSVYTFLKCVNALGFLMIINVVLNGCLIWFVATIVIITTSCCYRLLLLFFTTAVVVFLFPPFVGHNSLTSVSIKQHFVCDIN